MKVTHITPRLPPQRDGVGDFATLLAAELERGHRLESRFVVTDPSGRSERDGSSRVTIAPAPSTKAIMGALDSTETVILHYVGYGYHHRGVPLWLVRALEQWRRAIPGRRLITVFHELWSFGPPWRNAFFLFPLQRALVARLQRLSDGAITSVAWQKAQLDAIDAGKTVLQPVPPNVAVNRSRSSSTTAGAVRAIFFGLGPSRLHAVRTHERLLRALHVEHLLRSVDVVGAGAGDGPTPSEDVVLLRRFLSGASIGVRGNVSSEEAADRLCAADLFLSFYPARFACKSGAFMAALSVGCVPVLRDGVDAAPLSENREFLACDGSAPAIRRLIETIRGGRLADISHRGRQWQADHATWPKAANAVAAMLSTARMKPPGS